MISKTFILKIEVDEKNIRRKYPNFRFNWGKPKEFITFLKRSVEERHLNTYGYRMTVQNMRV